ncbi:hypothetical protein PG997_007173 [Apiospora hydei]|uniref:Uncharacterized protein n=1 Tax=Apiospora hydei TaxID=1337664 RepID=A0ABR1WQZ6_9PEZI
MSQATTASPASSPEQDETADLHVTSAAPAIIEWKHDGDDAVTVLSDPDPRSHHITFQMRHLHDPEQPAASFALHIPAKLKARPATPRSSSSSLPRAFSRSIKSRPPVDIVVPAEVPVAPLRAHKAATGQVLDLLPSLGRVTRLVLYVPANAFPKHKLDPICATIAEGRLDPTDRSDDLASLYSGSGGQILRFDDPDEAPPLYDDVPPSAPMAPILPEASSQGMLLMAHLVPIIMTNRPSTASLHKNSRKRSRRDRDSGGSVEEGRSRCCSSDEVMMALVAMRKQMAMQEDRMSQQSRRIDELEHQATKYQAELDGAQKQTAQLRQELDDAQEQIALLQGRVEVVEQEDLGRLDQEICGLREDLDALQEIEERGFDSDAENRITDAVTERVTSEMMDSGVAYNATVTFSRT